MNTITEVKGNLLNLADQGRYKTIAHGCNCFHVMGLGIAYQINKWSNGKASEVDKQTSYANINKLGDHSYFVHNGIEVFNLYTQYTTIPKGQQGIHVAVHWNSVYTALIGMFDNMQSTTVGLPFIGCGLAGGKEEELKYVLKKALKLYPQINVELVRYAP